MMSQGNNIDTKELLQAVFPVTNHDMALSQLLLSNLHDLQDLPTSVYALIQKVVNEVEKIPGKEKIQLDIDKKFFYIGEDINGILDGPKVEKIQKALIILEIMGEWLNKTKDVEKNAFARLDLSKLNSTLSQLKPKKNQDEFRYEIRNDIALAEKIFPMKKKEWRKAFLRQVNEILKDNDAMLKAINARQSIKKKNNQNGRFEIHNFNDFDELNEALEELDNLTTGQKEGDNYNQDQERAKNAMKEVGFSDKEIATMKASDILKYDAALSAAFIPMENTLRKTIIESFKNPELAKIKKMDKNSIIEVEKESGKAIVALSNYRDFQSHLYGLAKPIINNHMENIPLPDDVLDLYKDSKTAKFLFLLSEDKTTEKTVNARANEEKLYKSALENSYVINSLKSEIKKHYDFCKDAYDNHKEKEGLFKLIDKMRNNLLDTLADGRIVKAFAIVQRQIFVALNNKNFGGQNNTLYLGLNQIQHELKQKYPTHFELYSFIHENLKTTKEKVKGFVTGIYSPPIEKDVSDIEQRILNAFYRNPHDGQQQIKDIQNEINTILAEDSKNIPKKGLEKIRDNLELSKDNMIQPKSTVNVPQPQPKSRFKF